MNKNSLSSLFTVMALIMCLGVPGLADTIRLKDGSVIRGQVVGFKDQQFTVLVGAGARGRRSRISIYMEDVESVEFDSAGAPAADTAGNVSDETGPIASTTTPPPTTPPVRPASPRTEPTQIPQTTTTSNTQPAPRSSVPYFQVHSQVRGGSAAQAWTNSGLTLRRGQRLHISASGRISLPGNQVSTPTGLPRFRENDKLMPNDPTGGLIAVIGDDNDDFIFIGSGRDFVAQREGVLFLGLNISETTLKTSAGVYNVVIEAEPLSSRTR